ncbi:hormogonium polysaccharide biosynthesis protein HpsA [Coleofasciculus sp. E2-BRE-01]|uniref:hormogonium polysaccharide biosynthesis protein HpsA n=1 Tax=Coleofasciculus sp. E2-BRE-01 TaxID=3069524 RepID=UPI0033038461
MSTPKRFFQSTQNLFRPIWRLGRAIVRGFMNRLLRVLVQLWGNPSRLTQRGFVLPTVVMVMLVVTLLTTAIVFRSFDRAKNASNFRVNQAVLNAATPAINRAKAKIQALMEDQELPRGTPSEVSLSQVLNESRYELGDEERVKLAFGGETLTTAWRFPVDTDNNGSFDSITLYGVFFQNPPTSGGETSRKRTPLDARTPPMAQGATNPNCDAVGTSASLVGTQGWYQVAGKLKKAFFTYVVTVPITDIKDNKVAIQIPDIGNYEPYTGNKGFSALEHQLDVERIPLSNNAILYEDDVEMASGPAFGVNGRIFTNSNLLVKELGNPTRFFQVSSPKSCFYEAENSKIVVGGNFGYGVTRDTATTLSNGIETHLFQGTKDPNSDPSTGEELKNDNISVNHPSSEIAYNNEAYNRRIEWLVEETVKSNTFTVTGTPPPAAELSNGSNDPEEVKKKILERINNPANLLFSADDQKEARRDALEVYFRNRTRRVPYKEVPYKPNLTLTDALDGVESSDIKGLGTDELRPPDKWMFPFDPTDGKKATDFAKLTLKQSEKKLLPAATKFEIQNEEGKERSIGDRVLLGNNLPALWYKDGQFVGSEEQQDINETEWNYPEGEGPRARKTRVRALDELDTISRDGFWENAAAEQPKELLDGVGGLRIVTGAGVYLPPDDDITAANASTVVWPDTMPSIPPQATLANPPSWMDFPQDEDGKYRPYLKMRATAVYHYTKDDGKKPIACVATYYDPTNRNTVRNRTDMALADVSYDLVGATPVGTNKAIQKPPGNLNYLGGSNSVNGITFPPPKDVTDTTIRPYLGYQASLYYPNGRPVNQLLIDALQAVDDGDTPTLAQQGAIDSTICALQIYGQLPPQASPLDSVKIGGKNETQGGYNLPDGTIMETAFLDARQVKLLDDNYDPATGSSSLTSRYDLPIEQRYPLEVRATVIDLEKLREAGTSPKSPFGTSHESQEYIFPNSGIIYAARDDALPDASDTIASVSPTDFKLDPTRRPNGIMLINGSELGRRTGNPTFAEVEKGLILASNLPVYVKGEFNPHENASSGTLIGEFDTLTDNTDVTAFYSRSDHEEQFACRQGDERLDECTQGDSWRAATIISDAVTLLSSNFREGVRADGDYDLRNNQIDNIAQPDGTANIKTAADIRKARIAQGFWNNNFVTNGLSSGQFLAKDAIKTGLPAANVNLIDSIYSGNGTNAVSSSYFNNFVTPIQRRGQFREYVMEYCDKIPVSECTATDWKITATKRATDDANTIVGEPAATLRGSVTIGGSNLFAKAGTAGTTATGTAVQSSFNFGATVADGNLPLPDPIFENYPRRVAFLRKPTGELIVDDKGHPIPLGITDNGSGETIQPFPYNNFTPTGSLAGKTYCTFKAPSTSACDNHNAGLSRAMPVLQNNALWFTTVKSGGSGDPINSEQNYGYDFPLLYLGVLDETDNPAKKADPDGNGIGLTGQPRLKPVLQVQYTNANPKSDTAANNAFLDAPSNTSKTSNESRIAGLTNWLPKAKADTTIYNAAFATGDTPSRPPFDFASPTLSHQGDFNGGVPNLVRFIENWNSATSQIRGSFIQIKRSAYATAPYESLPLKKNAAVNGGLFGYKQIYSIENTEGTVSYFEPPTRNWGFDVGLLSQLPDLFAQQFTAEPTEQPNEFFREVNRDDPWVKTLLCATNDANKPVINEDQRPDCT